MKQSTMSGWVRKHLKNQMAEWMKRYFMYNYCRSRQELSYIQQNLQTITYAVYNWCSLSLNKFIIVTMPFKNTRNIIQTVLPSHMGLQSHYIPNSNTNRWHYNITLQSWCKYLLILTSIVYSTCNGIVVFYAMC